MAKRQSAHWDECSKLPFRNENEPDHDIWVSYNERVPPRAGGRRYRIITTWGEMIENATMAVGLWDDEGPYWDVTEATSTHPQDSQLKPELPLTYHMVIAWQIMDD